LYEAAMKGMVGSLEDRYSAYLTAEQLKRIGEETAGEFAGVGIVLRAADGRALVHRVLPGGPAEGAGVEAGDVITGVDGRDVSEEPLERIAAAVRGDAGDEVELTVLRPATGESLQFRLTRAIILVPNVESEMLEDGIGLVRVVGFDRNSAQEVGVALEELGAAGMKALVLDLRGNSGGLVKQATLVCDMFLSEGLIMGLRTRNGAAEPPAEAGPGMLIEETLPVAVLVDGGSASAAEIVAGALQAHERAAVVGTRTVGKGSVTTVLRLPDESGLILTVAHYVLEGGRLIEGKGIQPDVPAGELRAPPQGLDRPEATEWLLREREAAQEVQFQKAIALLKEKLAAD
ncbi:MAG: S41 family peptidase, partial [Planctomycetota bacterium]